MSVPVGDGSWVLQIKVTDVDIERSLRVKGDTHVGGVMFRLVEELKIPKDWSDHGLWWPTRNIWLNNTRSTLDQYGVSAESLLLFTPMHKSLRVQLPDLRYIDCKVDFSVKVFKAVCDLCKEFGIRYPEELSFKKPLEPDDLKYNYGEGKTKKKHSTVRPVSPDTNTYVATAHNNENNHHLSPGHDILTPSPARSPATPVGSPLTATLRNQSYQGYANGSVHSPNASMEMSGLDMSLAQSPQPSHVNRASLLRPKSLVERARMNVSWLDSSLSVMEQGIREYDTLLLRFKFYGFYDLNPKYDLVRINQLYEQSKWEILNEEIDCTEEEMMMFSALQLQINLQANVPQPILDEVEEDDVDQALNVLQTSLEGSQISSGQDITHIPQLSDYLRFLKPKRFTLKGWKRLYFVLKDMTLYAWKSQEESSREKCLVEVSLRGCEVTPDVHISQQRFGIKLEVPGEGGVIMQEMWLRCNSEDNYARWMAACKLAAMGKTMADASYKGEVDKIKAFLSIQRPAPAPVIQPDSLHIEPENYVQPKFIKKLRGKIERRILEAHTNVKELNLLDAKMQYIKAWQSLPDYGISLFVVRFMNHRKDELLGVAYNRLLRMDINTGDHIKTWRYNTLKAWNVNWEVRHMMVQFESSSGMVTKNESEIFSCLSADCKVVHEFIGGYIFLSMRSKDASQQLDEERFHTLTGGWV